LAAIPNKTRQWLIAAELPKWSWVPLYSTSSGKDLFEANAASRRLDVVWLGCDPKGRGWFFRLCRATRPTVDFSQGVEDGSDRTFESTDLKLNLLHRCRSGQEALQRLCDEFGISVPIPQVQSKGEAFQVLRPSGKAVKRALREVYVVYGAEIQSKKGQATKELARAIETCNAEGIRRAVEDGASLTSLPDSPFTPLQSALYRFDNPAWKECVRILVELGCDVNGIPNEDPPILDWVDSRVEESLAIEVVDLLLSLGADIDATSRSGQTALGRSVEGLRIELVRFLLERGANPKAKLADGDSIIDWARKQYETTREFSRRQRLAELLEMLTGEELKGPEVTVLSDDLKAENERFRQCHEARQILATFPEIAKLRKIKKWPFVDDRRVDTEPYGEWSKELLAKGFEPAGCYEPTWNAIFALAGFTNPALRLDAILYMQQGFESNCCCEITAYHPDGSVTVAASHAAIAASEFLPSGIVREEQQGLSPSELVKRTRELVSKRKKRKLAIDANGFALRYQETLSRLIRGIRNRAEHVQATPAILIAGRPARFERRRHYLDFSGFDDPAASSKLLADWSWQKFDEVGRRKDWEGRYGELSDAIRAAAELAAMRHFQYAGAPDSLDFLDRGVSCVATFHDTVAKTRWGAGAEDLALGMLLTALAGRWDVFDHLCLSAKPATIQMGGLGGESIGYERVLLAVASDHCPRAIPRIASILEDVRKGRHKWPKFALQIWEAILARSQADFETALRGSLDHLKEHPWSDYGPNQLVPQLAIAESILYMVGLRRGMQPVKLPEELADLLITPETIDRTIGSV
jgi:hypothetical protein